jgi:hypothetical protein
MTIVERCLPRRCHCEEQSDEAIPRLINRDCRMGVVPVRLGLIGREIASSLCSSQ